MLHAVLRTLEVKTRMTVRDVAKGWDNARFVMELANEVRAYGNRNGWTSVQTGALAYRLAQRLEATYAGFVKAAKPDEAGFDVSILRIPSRGQTSDRSLGAELHMEPVNGSDRFIPMCRLSHTALSDVYYRLVQDSYYVLAHRNWSYGQVGQQVMNYMAWATASWGEHKAVLRQHR
jgi:hypothetical protein